MPQKTIAHIHFDNRQMGQISQLLSESKFTLKEYESTKKSYDLLLYFIDSNDKTFKELIEIKNKDNKPVIIISPMSDLSFFSLICETGILFHMSIPCEKDFFKKQIEYIFQNYNSEKKTIEIKESPSFQCDINMPMIYLSEQDLSSFIYNILSNYIHQKKLFNELRKKSLLKHSKTSIFMDGTSTDKNLVSEDVLWQALKNKEFVLYYQPVINVALNRVSGFEALIRWKSPTKGLIYPDSFIPVAEESDLMFPLGLWIIEEASRQVSIFKSGYKHDLKVNVNLSPKQFVNEDLSKEILSLMVKNKIDPENIVLEITESAFMENMEMANTMLLELKAKKCLLYLDDFGTGYSSLSYLMHFPVDALKIDKSFVTWMHIDEQSEEIVRSIIGLAHNLKMKVVAEGVDDEAHIEMLKEFGCDYSQGYYHAKPLPANDAIDFLINYS